MPFASLQRPTGCWGVFWTKESENQRFKIFVQAYQKKLSGDSDQKSKNSPYLDPSRDNHQVGKHHVTMTKKQAYKSDNLPHQSQFLTFLFKNGSDLSANSVLSQRPNLKAYDTTISLDKITFTDYVDFGKCQDRFG